VSPADKTAFHQWKHAYFDAVAIEVMADAARDATTAP